MIRMVSDDVTPTQEVHQRGSLNDAALTNNEAAVNCIVMVVSVTTDR